MGNEPRGEPRKVFVDVDELTRQVRATTSQANAAAYMLLDVIGRVRSQLLDPLMAGSVTIEKAAVDARRLEEQINFALGAFVDIELAAETKR